MKLLEWVIEKHLWKHLEDASFLSIAVSKYHWGFRKAKLTNDQLFHLSQTVLKSFNRGKQVITSFLGVEKAFDNVWHNRLRYETLQLGLGKTHKSILLWETFFWTFGGGSHKNISQILAIIDFFKQRNYLKNLVSNEEYYRQHNFKPNKSFKLGPIWCCQLHSCLPIGTIHINYRTTRLGLGPVLHVIYISECTHFKLIIDFRLECF